MTNHQVPATPYDTKIATARREAERQERAIDEAQAARGEHLAAGERIVDELEKTGGAGSSELEEELKLHRAKYRSAEQDYVTAVKRRLRARARLTALEAAAERFLIEEYNIFPDRRSFPQVNGEAEARVTPARETEGGQGVPGPRSGNARAEDSSPAPARAPTSFRQLAAGVKDHAEEPETKDG